MRFSSREAACPLAAIIALAALGIMAFTGSAVAELRPDRFHTVQTGKSASYIRDGLFSGGDRGVDDVEVRDIRHSRNAGFERVVIDLGSHKAEVAAPLKRPPYFQVSVNPDEKRLVISVWGKPRLAFNAEKVLAAFRNSPAIRKLTLLPRLDPETWTFVAELRESHPVEVFELDSPARIILDLQEHGPKTEEKAESKLSSAQSRIPTKGTRK